MKHTILIFSMVLSATVAFSQGIDTTKTKPVIGHVTQSAPQQPRAYTIVLSEGAVQKLLQIIGASDEPYATVRRPLVEGILYQAQHQSVADTTLKDKQ